MSIGEKWFAMLLNLAGGCVLLTGVFQNAWQASLVGVWVILLNIFGVVLTAAPVKEKVEPS